MDRRSFVASSAAFLGVTPHLSRSNEPQAAPDLDTFIVEKMRRDHIPGAVVALIRGDEITWSKSYGFADLERRTSMSLDTIQNIASISKTFTTAALMQLVEAGRLGLDDDVGRHLSFPLRNPAHPRVGITARHLLTHRSSIRDGSAYARAYACGDPKLTLAAWLRGYFSPGSADYSERENFHGWAPGERWDYSNVAFGVAAHVVESIAKTPFEDYCRRHIFEPLSMHNTSWFLAKVDVSRHAVPYTYVAEGQARGPAWGGVAQGVIREPNAPPPRVIDGFMPNCLYNHPNFPDGFLRTSVRQLASAASAYLGGGATRGRRILEERTVKALLEPQHREGRRTQGLTWSVFTSIREQLAWGHGGSDPGVNTDLRLLPAEQLAAIAFLNTNGARPEEITERVLTVAPNLR